MIQNIITTLDNISNNTDDKPLYLLGGYIVGATLVRDDIEELREQYPLLEVISELGAELETIENNKEAKPIFDEFQHTLLKLKKSLKKNDQSV